MDAERRAKIEALFRSAHVRSMKLHKILCGLSWELKGCYGADQFAEMADTCLDAADRWLGEAEEELRRLLKEGADEA